jgi:hypothetical protein
MDPEEYDIGKGRDTIEAILRSDPTRLVDRKELLGLVGRFGVVHNDWAWGAYFQNFQNTSRFGIVQIPTEFVDFLLMLCCVRPTSMLEIGTLHGATAAIAAAVLSRFNPKFILETIDLADQVIDKDWLSSTLPVRFHAPASSNDFRGKPFDVCFVDADHHYAGPLRDWLNVGICAFHDIKAHEYDVFEGGTTRHWRELKELVRADATVLEISHSAPDWMGIGMVIKPEWMRCMAGFERPPLNR